MAGNRQIITIDEEKCTGCGECITGCPEGALRIIDGKARLVSDLFCDGLGACIGTCPEGAIEIIEREAQPYDERKVMENIAKQGANTIKAHLDHLRDHGRQDYYQEAVEYLKEKNINIPGDDSKKRSGCASGGCPGAMALDFRNRDTVGDYKESTDPGKRSKPGSQLRHWPIQLQLQNPNAPYFRNARLAIAADCAPFAYPDFHQRFLKDRILIILCPKLDRTLEEYVEKLAEIFRNQEIQSVSIIHMEVPCCSGIEKIVNMAIKRAGKNITIKDYTISIRGEII